LTVPTTGSTAGPPPRRRPPGRYDEPSRAGHKGVAMLLGVLFVGFLTAIAYSLYTRFGVEEVPVRERGFTVLGENAVRIAFDVTVPAGETAWCLVRARSAEGVEVGRSYVRVPGAADAGTEPVRYRLATRDRAVTGEVPRCTLTPPPADARVDEPST
jgi:hypothetical protein